MCNNRAGIGGRHDSRGSTNSVTQKKVLWVGESAQERTVIGESLSGPTFLLPAVGRGFMEKKYKLDLGVVGFRIADFWCHRTNGHKYSPLSTLLYYVMSSVDLKVQARYGWLLMLLES